MLKSRFLLEQVIQIMKNQIMDSVLLEWFLGIVSSQNIFTTVFCCQSTADFAPNFFARPTSIFLRYKKDPKNQGHLLVSARINFPDGVFVEIPPHPDINEELRAVRCNLCTPRRFCFGLLPARREGAILSVV